MVDSEATRWLDAHADRSAGVRTFGQCMALCDVSGSGDYGLIIAEPRPESRSRLRVYRGTTALWSDTPLQDVPSAVIAFYTDELEPRLPAVAVSCGSEVLIYKNNKPYFKFTVPNLPVTALEHDVWHRFTENYDPALLDDQLNVLKSVPYSELSARSQKLLTLPTPQVEEFIGRYIGVPPLKAGIITCLATLNRNSMHKDAVACLVLVTEGSHVYFLDPQGFTILHQASVCISTTSSPSLICVTGMFDVEFRCVIARRDGTVCLLRRDWLEGRPLFQAATTIIDMALMPADNFIVIATMDKQLICYTKRGKKIWSIRTTNAITCLGLVGLPHLNSCLIAVAQSGNTPLHLYKGRQLVDKIHVPETVAAIRFGQLGQEEHVLILVTQSGSLIFKILKRTADFTVNALLEGRGHAEGQIKALALPKRSQLFAEQALREKQNAQSIHQTFQQDLIRLRLTAGRATVRAQKMADQSVSESVKNPIKLSAQVLGLGPKFTLTITIENLSPDKAVANLSLVLHAQIQKYQIKTPYVQIPLLPPEFSYKTEITVLEILTETDFTNDTTEATPLRIFVVIPNQSQPVLAATIHLPPTDPLAFI